MCSSDLVDIAQIVLAIIFVSIRLHFFHFILHNPIVVPTRVYEVALETAADMLNEQWFVNCLNILAMMQQIGRASCRARV